MNSKNKQTCTATKTKKKTRHSNCKLHLWRLFKRNNSLFLKDNAWQMAPSI